MKVIGLHQLHARVNCNHITRYTFVKQPVTVSGDGESTTIAHMVMIGTHNDRSTRMKLIYQQ